MLQNLDVVLDMAEELGVFEPLIAAEELVVDEELMVAELLSSALVIILRPIRFLLYYIPPRFHYYLV